MGQRQSTATISASAPVSPRNNITSIKAEEVPQCKRTKTSNMTDAVPAKPTKARSFSTPEKLKRTVSTETSSRKLAITRDRAFSDQKENEFSSNKENIRVRSATVAVTDKDSETITVGIQTQREELKQMFPEFNLVKLSAGTLLISSVTLCLSPSHLSNLDGHQLWPSIITIWKKLLQC